jgi:hypothetical protein
MSTSNLAHRAIDAFTKDALSIDAEVVLEGPA